MPTALSAGVLYIQLTDNLALLIPRHRYASLQALKQSLRIHQRLTQHRVQ